MNTHISPQTILALRRLGGAYARVGRRIDKTATLYAAALLAVARWAQQGCPQQYDMPTLPVGDQALAVEILRREEMMRVHSNGCFVALESVSDAEIAALLTALGIPAYAIDVTEAVGAEVAA